MLWLLSSALAGDALPEGWTASPPILQTYTAQTSFDQFSSCSQSWSKYTAKTAMVLELAEDGQARGCREKVANSRGPDSAWRTEDRLGMVGTWKRDGDWIDLTLRAAEGVCVTQNVSSRPEPADWVLRCTQAAAPEAVGLPGSPLVCRFVTSVYSDALGFEVYRILPYPGEWLVLGDGDGVVIVQDDTSPFDGMKTEIRAGVAPRDWLR